MMDLLSSPSSTTSLSDCESIAIPPCFQSRVASPAPELSTTTKDTNTTKKRTKKTKKTQNTMNNSDGPAEDAKKDRGQKGEEGKKKTSPKNPPATSTDPSHTLQPQPPPPPAAKPRRARKRKDDDKKEDKKTTTTATNTTATRGKKNTSATGEVKQRKPRNSNNAKAAAATTPVSNDTSTTATSTTTTSRKKAKLEHVSEDKPASTSTRQTKITDLVSPTPPHPFRQTPPTSSPYLQPRNTTQSVSHPPPPQPANHHAYHAQQQQQQHSPHAYPLRDTSYDVKSHPSPVHYPYHGSGQPDYMQLSAAHSPQSQPPPPPPPQRSSGQNYDPIRSTTIGSFPPPTTAPSASSLKPNHGAFSPPQNAATPSPNISFRASASPAIASIIDPPAPVTTSTPMVVVPSQNGISGTANSSLSKSPAVQPNTVTATNDNNNNSNKASPSNSTSQQPVKPETNQTASKDQAYTPMEIDNKDSTLNLPINPKPAAPSKKANSTSTTPAASGAPSPKPARSKDAPPLLPGSGLLTGAMFGVDALKASASESKSGPNIILHIPLNTENRVINFAKLAEEQYGFEALHPRIAAQKERRARLDAASAALEKNEKPGSGAEEDLSADMDRDSEADGDVAMSGMGATGEDANGAGSGDAPAKRRRRKKIEEYNRDDPFIDDSEMIWEEQAAACKDGFFVYSGPLVAEGEKVNVEKADGTVKRPRGGNRRGGGAAGQGGGAAGGAGASSRGRGGAASSAQQGADGSAKTTTARGGPRKPRMTKADKALMEKEKAEREKLGAGMVPGKSGSGSANATTAATGNGTK